MFEVQVHEAGATGDLVGIAFAAFVDGDPGQCCAGGLGVEGGFYPVAQVCRGGHGVDHVLPDGGIEGYGLERGDVREGERFEADVGAF